MTNVAKGVNFRGLKMTRTESLRETYSKVERATLGTVSNDYNVMPDNQFDHMFVEYDLTAFQASAVWSLSEEFKNIACAIDPEKLSFKVGMNLDDDLVLYRRSSKGLINLIIHDEELIAYSFVSNSNATEDKLSYFSEEEGAIDFEKIAYHFLLK